MNKQVVEIRTEDIGLAQLIKFSGLAKSGAEAKAMIETGQVSVGGVKCLVLRKKIRPGDIVSLGEKTELLVEKEKRV